MNSKACTPHNVIAPILNEAERMGKEIPQSVINKLDNGGKASLSNAITKTDAELYDTQVRGAETSFERDIIEQFSPSKWDRVKAFLANRKNPSRSIDKSIVEEVNAFLEDLASEFNGDLAAGKGEYFQTIHEIFADVDTSGFSPSEHLVYNKYRRYYEDGGPLYNKAYKDDIKEAFGNLGQNVIKSSPTAIIGNVFEGAIKIPTMYPAQALPAIAKIMRDHGPAGFFKKLPQYEAKGIYGLHYAGEDLGQWGGILAHADIPFKNLVATAAEMAGESPTLGVQKIAFVHRLGDIPPMFYSSEGRLMSKFLNYTIGTYEMYHGMWAGLGNPKTMARSLQQLTTYHALAALMGGGTAAVPQVYQTLIETVFPDTKEWFADNRNGITELIQPGDFSRIGILGDIGSRQIQRGGRDITQGIEHLQEGDVLNAALDGADIALTSMAFTASPLGDLNLQKFFTMARDVARGELELEDVPEEALKKATPWNR